MLTCFGDADSRLRYYACEALYNIVKVARGAIVPHFNVLFDGLSKVTTPEGGKQFLEGRGPPTIWKRGGGPSMSLRCPSHPEPGQARRQSISTQQHKALEAASTIGVPWGGICPGSLQAL